MRNFIPLYAILVVCILAAGCASKEMAPEPVKMPAPPAVSLLLTPAETLTSGDPVALSVIGFDANGKQTSAIGAIEWAHTGLTGAFEDGTFTPDKSAGSACRNRHCAIRGYEGNRAGSRHSIAPVDRGF